VAPTLVLGANGFIGGWVAESFRDSGGELAGAGLGAEPPGFLGPWFDLDLLTDDVADVARLIRDLGPRVVVNCTGATVGSSAELMNVNAVSTSRLLEAIAASGLAVRLIHIGSGAEYGRADEEVPVAESACPMPLSPYGIAKLAATQLVLAATAAGAVDGIVLRVFNALGPCMGPGTLPGSATRQLLDALRDGTSQIEMGPLGSVRDFVDVRDIGAAVVAAAGTASIEARLVNVGSGHGHTARDLVSGLARRLGFHGTVAERAAGSPRSSDVPWQVADISLAVRAIGWRPVHDLDSSLGAMAGAARAAGEDR
jgi:nucleoside-diphosphate-sugar epimerase